MRVTKKHKQTEFVDVPNPHIATAQSVSVIVCVYGCICIRISNEQKKMFFLRARWGNILLANTYTRTKHSINVLMTIKLALSLSQRLERQQLFLAIIIQLMLDSLTLKILNTSEIHTWILNEAFAVLETIHTHTHTFAHEQTYTNCMFRQAVKKINKELYAKRSEVEWNENRVKTQTHTHMHMPRPHRREWSERKKK